MSLDLFEPVVVTVLRALALSVAQKIFTRLMRLMKSFACWRQEQLRTNRTLMKLRYRVRYPWDSERRADAEFYWGFYRGWETT